MPKRSVNNLFRSILLTLNLVFIVLIFFSLLASALPPSSYSFFSVFGLLFSPLLVVNLLFIVIWGFLRSRKFIFSLIMVIVSLGQIKNNFQWSAGSDSTADQGVLRVITYNVQRFGMDAKGHKFDRNREEILRFIGETDSDIVCIQEYHGKGKTLYEPLQQNKEMLGAESYYYESYFNPRYQQLTGLAIFTKLKAVNKGKLIFEGSRTFGIFTDLLTGNDTIRVFNIHLASIQLKPSDIDFVVNPGQNQDEMGIHALRIYDKLNEAFKLRERQMEQIVKELENCKYPVILAGDFNDTPTSYTYRNTKALLEDTFREKGTGFSITYAGRIPFLRIDYIMKSKEFKTKKYRRHMVEYSDHYPVAAEVYR